MNFSEQIAQSVLCGDGAMGTYLLDKGVALNSCLEGLVLENPTLIQEVHEEYIAAGAQVIETNTFGANAPRLARFGWEDRVASINTAAVEIAQRAVGGRPVFIAGSVGPCSASFPEEPENYRSAFEEQIASLAAAGVDLLLLETFVREEELAVALDVAQKIAPDLPRIASMSTSANGTLPSGATLSSLVGTLQAHGATMIGVNCLSGPQAALQALKTIDSPLPLCAYPNAGYPRYAEGHYVYDTLPDYFATMGERLAQAGARLVGGCCGTTPEHIAALARALQNLSPPKQRKKITSRSPITPAEKPTRAIPAPRENILERWRRGEKVVITEFDPPKTLSLERFFQGACALAEAGSDAITLADNSLAILRVSNLALGSILRQKYDITPLLHLSCRDKNVLGLQSELLGMAALDIDHVLPLTGDPAKVGDHPGSKSVFEINSIGLIEMIAKLNRGINHAGNSIKHPTQFTIGCTFNPNSRNLPTQVKRLERKIAAGAQYVMTQPVFDAGLITATRKATAHLDVPIFIGIWPLMNSGQTEFLHHEVPGITIPDSIRERMAGLSKTEGEAAGLEIARELTDEVFRHYHGVYLITPFLRYDLSVALIEHVRGK